MTGLVDSHVHFWDRDRFDYAWLDQEPAALRRSFIPADLDEGSDSVVFVQADCRDEQSYDEAVWVHELAAVGAAVVAVVAHAPLENDDGGRLTALADLPLVAGVRRLLQDAPVGFALSDAFQVGVARLARYDFSFDLCIRQHQLAEVTELVARHPDVQFVLDHLGKPVIDPLSYDRWAREMATLAALPNVACKLSGLLSEAPPRLRDAGALRPWLHHALEVFGAERCLYGSDWPVLTAIADRTAWLAIVESLLVDASPDERSAVLGRTATRIYAR